MSSVASSVPVLDKFLRGDITVIETPYTGHIRYEVTPHGVDPAPLVLMGLLPESTWCILAQENGRLVAVESAYLTDRLRGIQRMRAWGREIRAAFHENHQFLWFVLAVIAVGGALKP